MDGFIFLNAFFSKYSLLRYPLKFTNSIAAAEAKYHICEIAYQDNDYTLCESLIMELVQQKPSYDYWLAKGILLLGDNLTAQKDYFNAKHSIESILENYQGIKKDEILANAIQKMEYIKSLELNEFKTEPVQQEIEIDLDSFVNKDENKINVEDDDLIENNKDENK